MDKRNDDQRSMFNFLLSKKKENTQSVNDVSTKREESDVIASDYQAPKGYALVPITKLTEIERDNQRISEQLSNIIEGYDQLIEQNERTKKAFSKMYEEINKIDEQVTSLTKFTEREKRNVLKHKEVRVKELMSIYGDACKKKLDSNIQGHIFKRYSVNSYEELLLENLPNIIEDITVWKPSEDLEKELLEIKEMTEGKHQVSLF